MVATFLGSLAAGMLLALSSAAVERISARFLRLIGLISLGVSIIIAAAIH